MMFYRMVEDRRKSRDFPAANPTGLVENPPQLSRLTIFSFRVINVFSRMDGEMIETLASRNHSITEKNTP